MNTEDLIKKFFENRDFLIDEFEAKKIDKTSFIEKNYEFIMNLNLKPFASEMDYRKCIYNYQYYNILAKYRNLEAKDIEFFDKKESERLKEEELYYYKLKDEVTLLFLNLIDYKNVSAYFLNTNSIRLDGKLYEIVFHDYDRAIFHSLDKKILNKLRDRDVFSPVYKDSVISDYVNSSF